jgi:hypothetical protein
MSLKVYFLLDKATDVPYRSSFQLQFHTVSQRSGLIPCVYSWSHINDCFRVGEGK